MSNELKDIRIPADGYALVRDIKHLDGRLDFLNTWTTEIKKHMATNRGRHYDGIELVDSSGVRKRLRVIDRPRTRVARFDFEGFKSGVERSVYEGTVREIAPARPKTLRISAALPGKRSLEWKELETEGRKAEVVRFPDRDNWRSASAKVVSGGLFTLGERIRVLEAEKEHRRGVLLDLAAEQDWDDYLWGNYDGRIIFNEAKPRRELRNKEAAMREYYRYVKHSDRESSTTVGFYPVKDDDAD